MVNRVKFFDYVQEMVDSNSALRPALPDLLRLMLDFTLLSIRAPTTEFLGKKKDSVSYRFLLEYADA